MISIIKWGALAGVLGTLCMDLGSGLLRATGLTRGVSIDSLQRWFGHAARGRVVHADIASAPDVVFPMPLVMLTHYGIGITLGIAFLAGYQAWLAPRPPLPLAIAYGVATSLIPWLFMFPAMGYGAFGLGGPEDLMLFRTSLLNHVLFGVGLGLGLVLFARRIFAAAPANG